MDTVAQFSRALAAKLQDLSVQLREVKDNNRWAPAVQEHQAVCPADESEGHQQVCIHWWPDCALFGGSTRCCEDALRRVGAQGVPTGC